MLRRLPSNYRLRFRKAWATAIARNESLRLAEFSTWPTLYQFKACRSNGERVIVKPDGFIRIHEKESDGGISGHTFFLEVDRSTEALDVLRQRAHSYLDYYRSGGFAIRRGGRSDEYKKFPFRVFWVCKSVQRQQNIIERFYAGTPPILMQALIGTLEDAANDPLGENWMTPMMAKEAGNSLLQDQSLAKQI
jgi:hypothetical protein